MNKKAKTLLGLLLLAAFIALALFAYNTLRGKTQEPERLAPEASSAESEQLTAPDFTVFDAQGDEVKFSSLIGKPIVLNFWASWCAPCKSEMPEFDSVYEELGDEIKFMMVDLVDGQTETVETGSKYVEDQGFSFPVYYDAQGEAAMVYGITAIPTTVFIDSEGVIVTGAQGAIDEEILRRGIEMIKTKNE